jgi:glycerol kinase
VSRFVLALDQGTTSSRAIVFDHAGSVVALAQEEFPQIFPRPGEVEHDPEAIWSSQLRTARLAIEKAGATARDMAAIGVTNQRETTVLWERSTGKPVANAIVWQSRVSAPICERLRMQGAEPLVREKTGLLLDPYFSGTKIAHLFERDPALAARVRNGEILFGTIESFLIWRLTGGRRHITDVSNASRTLLLNIHTLDWDDELLALFGVPRCTLPEVRSNSEIYGEAAPEFFGTSIPISGASGDQQAALFGQACFEPGMAKNTYGTGCFLLLNTGNAPRASQAGLLTTVGWRLNGEVTYCLEGAVFIAGAVVQWLRDGLKIIRNSKDVESLAAADSQGVYFVPAFVGLGAPHWDPYARGTILGVTRDTTSAHIVRAALESIAYQTRDVLTCMQHDAGVPLAALRVDGGASVNNGLMQFQADILGIPVLRPRVTETTALGAAYLAGLGVGYWHNVAEISSQWQRDREFLPVMPPAQRDARYAKWQKAVGRALRWEDPNTSGVTAQ